MKNSLIPILVTVIILSSAFITSAVAGQSSNEKIPVIIGFKDMPDAALVKAHGGEIKYQYGIIPAIAASLPVQAIDGLKNNPNVAYIEDDVEVYILGDYTTMWVEDNDAETPWGVDRIDAEKAHALNFTGKGVKVAVIDTGIDYNHPDLKANYVMGYDYVNDDSDPLDDNGHGTHVAGTIAAVDNDKGVVGVAPDAKLYAIKVLDRRGRGSTSDVIAAINWSKNNNMDVISMSLGSSYNATSLKDACDAARDAGIVLVASAGNNYGGTVSYPAAYNSVIAVSATNYTDGIAYFSSTGPEVELAAPGVNVLSTYPGGLYATGSGTSMAAPHVSGVVALLLSGNNTLRPLEVCEKLHTAAIDLGPEGKDDEFGYGLVHASVVFEYISTDPDPITDPDPVTDLELKYTVDLSDLLEKAGGKFVYKTAEVTVTDLENNPISNIEVRGYWTIAGEDKNEVSGTTNTTGQVAFKSELIKNAPEDITFEFTVTAMK